MAKYTELLADYLQSGGGLPAIFENIEGFTDLFCLRFFDREIGFETETLFAMKLELIADIYVPIYEQRISSLANAWLKVDGASAFTHYEKTKLTDKIPEMTATTTDLPFNSSTSAPKTIVVTDDHDDIHISEKTNIDVKDAYNEIDELNKAVKPLIQELLNHFEPCFMQIF